MQTLEIEQKQVLETEVTPLVNQARSLIVKNYEQRSEAVSFAERIKAFKKSIEDRFAPTGNKKKAYELYEATLATEKAFYVPLDQALEITKNTVNVFDRDEALRVQREAEVARVKRQEEERKERERLEDIALEEKLKAAEALRLENEARERAAAAQIELDEAKLKVAQASIAGDKVAEKVAEIQVTAKEKEIKVETQNAETLEVKAAESDEKAALATDQSKDVVIETKFTPPPAPVKKLIWKAKVVSVRIACRSIGEGLIPFQAVEFKQSILNDMGKNYDGVTRIPGIEFTQDVSGRL